MKRFQLTLFDGHPIIYDGENIILIDTGAPTTIHKSTEFTFDSKEYSCSTNYIGLTVSEISELLGMEITTLLGADILSNYKILFDYQNEMIEFSTTDIPFEGYQTSISNFMGIPIIELSVDNQKLNFFLDTGAKLSYLSKGITGNHESIGTEEDFYPGVGNFSTECFQIETSIENTDFLVKYGNLPNVLQMSLMLGGTDGIIGYDFFKNFQIMLDLQNRTLKYQ